MKAHKLPVVLKYTVTMKPGMVETKEGPRTCDIGDFILTGTQNEQWPVKPGVFHARYDILAEGECQARPVLIDVTELKERTEVRVSWCPEALVGLPGDYLAEYGPGDYGVISRDIFQETYTIVNV